MYVHRRSTAMNKTLVYVCIMYIYIYLFRFVCVYVCMYVCMYRYLKLLNTDDFIYASRSKCMCVRISLCNYVCMYEYVEHKEKYFSLMKTMYAS